MLKYEQFRTGFEEVSAGPGPQACHRQRASHRTVLILFLANDGYLREYDLVVAHC